MVGSGVDNFYCAYPKRKLKAKMKANVCEAVMVTELSTNYARIWWNMAI